MSTITIDLDELRTLLNRVIPFAADSKVYGGALPVLETVNLQVRGGHLVASTTDRYVLGMARTPIEGGDGFEALIKLRDVKHILSVFKSRRGIATKITLTRTGGTADGVLAVGLADGLFADAEDLAAKYSLFDGEFPKVHDLFGKWQAANEAPSVGYNPTYLAKFQHVVTRNEPIRVSPGAAHKPTIVQAGDYFLGAIMPVALGDNFAVEVSDWTSMFQPAKPAAKRATRTATKTAAKPRTRVKKPAA